VPSTPFSQAPRYALPVHLCRFRVRSITVGLFPGSPRPPAQSNKGKQLSAFVTPTRLGNIDPIPIDYGFRPRLRGRLTLRGLTLRRNPWTFGDRVSHSVCRYSCQHSHLSYLQDGSPLSLRRLRQRSATAFRGQKTDDRRRMSGLVVQGLQHPADRLIFVTPSLPNWLVDIGEVERIAHPHPHLIARADRHLQKAFELRFRALLATISFSDVRADGLGCSPDLVGQSALLHRRKGQARPMDLERQTVRTLEDLQIFERNDALAPSFHLSSVVRLLS